MDVSHGPSQNFVVFMKYILRYEKKKILVK